MTNQELLQQQQEYDAASQEAMSQDSNAAAIKSLEAELAQIETQLASMQ